ncbi:MAG: hemerythrin domain-containing protein [Bryobacteraceae bacterium]|nr:hemerythrin domain-containing protein [Bryobacteraceae bacterium]
MIQQLMDEHRVIEQMLTALETRINALETAGEFPAAFLTEALDFFRDFADTRHHHKEEDLLFPAMIAAGLPSPGGPVDCMLHEHETGRAYLAAIRANLPAAAEGDPAARDLIRSRATAYIDMLRHHIYKEDNVLFPMAQRLLGADALEAASAR